MLGFTTRRPLTHNNYKSKKNSCYIQKVGWFFPWLISSLKSVRESWKILRQKARWFYLTQESFQIRFRTMWVVLPRMGYFSRWRFQQTVSPLSFLFWSLCLIFFGSWKQEKRECFHLEHMILYQSFCPNEIANILKFSTCKILRGTDPYLQKLLIKFN